MTNKTFMQQSHFKLKPGWDKLDHPEAVNERDLKMIFAGVLFGKGRFSSGQAASAAGIIKKEF